MKLCVISFTENGKRLSKNIAGQAGKMTDQTQKTAGQTEKIEIELFTKHKASAEHTACIGQTGGAEHTACIEQTGGQQAIVFVETPVGEWAKEQMQERNGMLFIGSCGIAVRAIAPYVKDKQKDAPVLVMDEKGKFVIPVLSGHIGGANELALFLAKLTGAEPVITTATDINKKFAVDLFAKENGLAIVNKDGIAKVSSKVLDGKEITISVSPEALISRKNLSPEAFTSWQNAAWIRRLPPGVRVALYSPEEPSDILITAEEDLITAKEKEPNVTLILRPREYVIGIGCRKGKPETDIRDFISNKLYELGISETQIFAVASVEQKREEPGILAWCRKEAVPFFTYTAEELQKVKGNFEESSFVKAQVGVDNVCERAAIQACGTGGRLIARKYAEDGMTIAVAKRKWGAGSYEP
ncbi:MAG: cobalt-precorrin 5A hydrolase [Eubacterium sp.]|nr:cobalt-precorrin 5A hydrolase [Eubacterium sp.]